MVARIGELLELTGAKASEEKQGGRGRKPNQPVPSLQKEPKTTEGKINVIF